MEFKTQLGTLIRGDARELIKKIPDESVDLILTDPPYGLDMDEFDDPEVFFQLEDEFYRVLKPSGFLVFFYAVKHLDRVFTRLKRFKYRWLIPVVVLYRSRASYSSIGVNMYTPVLVYSKGDAKPCTKGADVVFSLDKLPFLRDNAIEILQGIDKQALKQSFKQFKNETAIASLLRRFSREGDLVLDPFSGYGTVPYISELFRRRWIAFELDERKYSVAVKLLSTLNS